MFMYVVLVIKYVEGTETGGQILRAYYTHYKDEKGHILFTIE